MKSLRLFLLALAACVVAVLFWRLSIGRPTLQASLTPPGPVETRPAGPVRPPIAPEPSAAPAPMPAAPPAAGPSPVPPAASPQTAALPPAGTAVAPAPGQAGGSLSDPKAAVEARLRDVPEFQPFYGRFARDMPRLYEKFVSDLVPRLTSGTLPDADNLVWEAFHAVQDAQGLAAAKAGNTTLQSLFDARLAVLDGLASVDTRQCADFLYGQADSSLGTFTKNHRSLVSSLLEAQLTAITEGKVRGAEHAKPTTADFDLLSAGLAAHHLTNDEIAVLIDGKTQDPPTPEDRMCAMGRAFLDTLRQLPDEPRQRIYGLVAELLARS